MDMSDLKDRLRAVRATQQELADWMGVDLKVVNRIANPHVKGGRKYVSTQEAEQINSFFAAREKLAQPEYPAGNERSAPGHALHEQRGTVPLYGGLDTPEGYQLSVSSQAQNGRILSHPGQAMAREAYAVTVIDETMSPRFEAGEIAYVAVGKPPRRGQDCLAVWEDLTARVLQFVERNERQIVLKQLNPSKQVILRATDRVKVHAIVGRG